MLHATPARRFLASFAAVIASMSISLTAASAENPRERAAMLASQAEKILNSYAGRQETLAQAQRLINEALALDPDSGHALVEQGRAILMSDPYRGGYSRQAVQASAKLFMRAAELKPPYGRGFVLLGHLYIETDAPALAHEALKRAEALVPDDPWLKLNWSQYYAKHGEFDKEAMYAEQAIATGTTNTKALKAAHSIAVKYALKNGDRKKADAAYAEMARIQSNDPWTRGNYARDVIMYFADFDAGERLAREALEIMDFGHARQTLSLALYGKWAQAVKDGKPAAAQDALYETANGNDPGGRQLPECATNSKSVGFVFEAVAKKGIERQSMQRC